MALRLHKFIYRDGVGEEAVTQIANATLRSIGRELHVAEWLLLTYSKGCELFIYDSHFKNGGTVRKILQKHGIIPESEPEYSSIEDDAAISRFLQIATGIVDEENSPRLIERLREVYTQAVEQGTIGPIIHRLFQRGIWLHEKARMETEYFRFPTREPAVLLELTGKIFGNLKAATLQVVGCSAEATPYLEAFFNQGCHEFFVGEKEAEQEKWLDHHAGCNFIILDRPVLKGETDVLLVFSANDGLVTRDAISRRMRKRNNAPLFIFDWTKQFCSDPHLQKLYNVFCYNRDDLTYIIEQNRQERQSHRSQIVAWIDKEIDQFNHWLESDRRYQFAGIIGSTSEMQRIFELISRIAQTDITVLIQGESGTGKELVARAIHQLSGRAKKPFIVVNCAAIPENLLESELFGHVRGAFTGAIAHKKGLFAEAEHGTIFLDEIAELSPALQVKLLRFLQEGEIKQVGSNETLKLDVRVLAATNNNLELMVDEGDFRNDLYYRLNVILIFIPPLRERSSDIPILAQHFLKHFARKLAKDVADISKDAKQAMKCYRWPGNVRELENAIEHAVALSISNKITLFDLPLSIQSVANGGDAQFGVKIPTLKEVERSHILKALDLCNWNYEVASKQLGIGRTTLWRKLREYHLDEAEA